MYSQHLQEVIIDLYEIGVFQFGSFTLKTGITSPIYVDLRRIISQPQLLIKIAKLMEQYVLPLNKDVICGVPYTALPIATVISIETNIPMVLKRKEAKSYGLKKVIEGIFCEGDRCIIIEDIITSGSSILETKQDLEKEGLRVSDAVVFLNRNQGAEDNLKDKDVNVFSVCNLYGVLDVLLQAKKIDLICFDDVMNFLTNNPLNKHAK